MNKRFFSACSSVLIILFLCTAFTGCSHSRESTVKIPELTSRVMDTAGLLERDTQYSLENYLENLDKTTGIQLIVFTFPSLKETAGREISIEEYAIKVFEKWKPGRKEIDNGILFLVSLEDHELRIETGYGLEGVLTDTKCGLIIRNIIIPHFKNNDYQTGIVQGVKAASLTAQGKLTAKDLLKENALTSDSRTEEKSSQDDSTELSDTDISEKFSVFNLIPFAFWFIFILIIVLSNIFGKKHKDSDDDDDPPHTPLFGDPCSGTGSGGSWHSGRGGFGGGHGGFSGGGGRSGGGGAGGRW